MIHRQRKAVAISHVEFEGLGTLRSVLEARDFFVEDVDAATASWENLQRQRPDLLVVLGGPLGVADLPKYPFLRQEVAYIQQCLRVDIPMIGVCLGAQLIAHALGAEVEPMGVKEIGFGRLSLTDAGIHSPLRALGTTEVLHWHGDQFQIPRGAANLAATALCGRQAFALGNQVLGLQFHMEVDPRRIERWLVGNAVELGHSRIDPQLLREDARRIGTSLIAAARNVFNNWLDRAYA